LIIDSIFNNQIEKITCGAKRRGQEVMVFQIAVGHMVLVLVLWFLIIQKILTSFCRMLHQLNYITLLIIKDSFVSGGKVLDEVWGRSRLAPTNIVKKI
jgi:hypothetical protein